MKKILLIVLSCLLLASCSGKDEEHFIEEEMVTFVEYESSIPKEDGWVTTLMISVQDVDANKSRAEQMKAPNTLIILDGYNLKHKKIEGVYVRLEDKNGNKIDELETMRPTYSTYWEHEKEITSINKFLNEKKFENEITIDDLSEIETNFIPKEDIVKLYNEVLQMKKTDFGKYMKFSEPIFQRKDGEGLTWQFGVYLSYANITDFQIQVIDQNGNYLEDKKSLSKEEKEMLKEIDIVEEYVIKTQSFDFSNIKDIKVLDISLLEEMAKGLGGKVRTE